VLFLTKIIYQITQKNSSNKNPLYIQHNFNDHNLFIFRYGTNNRAFDPTPEVDSVESIRRSPLPGLIKIESEIKIVKIYLTLEDFF
jgi:hypothetical protein